METSLRPWLYLLCGAGACFQVRERLAKGDRNFCAEVEGRNPTHGGLPTGTGWPQGKQMCAVLVAQVRAFWGHHLIL